MKPVTTLLYSDRFDGLVYPPTLLDRLVPMVEGEPVLLRPEALDSPEATAQLARTEVLFTTWGCPTFNADLLARMPRLRAVFYGAGSVKQLVSAAFWERDISLCSAWRANAIPVAEFTLGAILLSLKNIWSYHRTVRSAEVWHSNLPMPGAFGSTVGLVSLGAIGRLVVELLRPFSIRVLAYDPYLSAEAVAALGVELVPLETLFEKADVVSLHIPWLPETEKMINRPLLERLRPHATLINTARGAVIDEDDLAAVFSERPDLSAILDVTHPEPPKPDSPLWRRPNIQFTPHVAGSMPREYGRLGSFMVDEFLRWSQGDPLQHQVTPEVLARMA
jgi:phosphoglycerate dehydrogenase-like enzyme